MSLKREGCPRPSISRKDCGQAEWVAGMFFLLMLGIILCVRLQLDAWQSSAGYLEDALAVSNLASALIDVEEYGRSHAVLIADASAAYAVYLDAVRDNLQLNDRWECGNRTLISGPVEIADYVIYNVRDDRVETIRVGRDGNVTERYSGLKGAVCAPNGVMVECTGVYSEIQFNVKGFLGIEVRAHKGKLVDVAAKGGEEDEEQ
ncbi:MAG: hypothetical protein NC079_09595 [Clostridium sp.]|nr:hypothetical protein [Acetatifactor muris]MCM1527605.1 hypothetical protein [Bacteroides sp.]MCM1563846.1 hypothetical protein [Clostridium sp.]